MLKSWLYIISIVIWNNFISQPFFFLLQEHSPPFFSYLVFRNHPLNVINSFWLLFPFAKLFRKLKCESVHDDFLDVFEHLKSPWNVYFLKPLKLRNSTFDQKSLCVCLQYNMMRFLTNWYNIIKTLKSIFIEKQRYKLSEDALSESNNFILLC